MIEDVLLAYYDRVRREAVASYRHEQLIYVMRAPYATRKIEPPEVPRILKDREP